MECTSDQLFSRARLAINENRDMTLRETTNRAKNFLHGRCITNDLRCPAFSRFFRGLQLGVSLGLRSSDGGYHLIYIERLG